MNKLSLWVEFCMNVIAETVLSCIKDSKSLLVILIRLGKIPPGYRLLLSDVIVHADTSAEHGLEMIRFHVTEFRHELPTIFPAEDMLEGLQIAMQKIASNLEINYLNKLMSPVWEPPELATKLLLIMVIRKEKMC